EIFCRIETKNGAKQIAAFNLPEKNALYKKDSYIVIRNLAESEISIMNSSSRQIYLTMDGAKTIPKYSSGIFSSADRNFISTEFVKMLIKDGKKENSLPIKNFSSGTIYTCEYDGSEILLADIRPFFNAGEESFSLKFDNSFLAGKMLLRSSDDILYAVGTETAFDKNRNPFKRGCIKKIYTNTLASNKTECESFSYPEESSFFDSTFCLDENIVVAGQSVHNDDVRALLVSYAKEGALISSVESKKEYAFCAVCAEKNIIYVAGIQENGTVALYSFSGANLSSQKKLMSFSLPNKTELADLKMHFSKNNHRIFMAVSLLDSETGKMLPAILYQINLKENSARNVQMKIPELYAISSFLETADGTLYISGESDFGGNSSAVIMRLNDLEKGEQVLYRAAEISLCISDMSFNEEYGIIIFSGMTTHEKKRVPFLRAIECESGKVLWTQKYGKISDVQDATFLLSCADYGFFVGMSALDADNRRQAPFKIVRVTFSGRITEQHKTIQLQGVSK
ncbi:MAG: hypothetical protein K2J68_03860, partial [Treponemataceae bacterium]|nr:hypothetical protein [Treponemataceae bacterium]